MLYKRSFGKKGLVAALVTEQTLADRDAMARLEGACVQCGITQEYAIDIHKAVADPAKTVEGAEEMVKLANHIVTSSYRAVVTIGPQAYNAIDMAMQHHERNLMHIGIDTTPGDGDDAFRMANLDPLFEKNISAQDRLYVVDRLSHDQAEARMAQQREAARDRAMEEEGFIGVVGRDGRPTVVRVNAPDPFDGQEVEEDIFEA